MRERLLIDGHKLASLRTQHYLTQEELALRLGMSAAGVRRLEQSRPAGMQVRNFRKLAEVSRLSPDQLRQRIGAMHFRNDDERPAHAQQPSALGLGGRLEVVELSRYHGVSASRTEDRMAVQRTPVPAPGAGERRFAAVVDGDCMEPRYRSGDVVIFSIDAAEREGIVDGRNYYVQLTTGENTFKRLVLDPANRERVTLQCWNPRYPPRTVERSQIQLLARAQYRMVPDETLGEDAAS